MAGSALWYISVTRCPSDSTRRIFRLNLLIVSARQ
jgi:hypothetical protein